MLQEIANQKGVSCRAQGWKVHLCAAQLLQLVGGPGAAGAPIRASGGPGVTTAPCVLWAVIAAPASAVVAV